MTIIEALNEICEKQIPKEINGVRTKYIIHERKISDYPEASEVLAIMIRIDLKAVIYVSNMEIVHTLIVSNGVKLI